jgi:oligopeptide/dipeptide ABC transporter ATP-binding protein
MLFIAHDLSMVRYVSDRMAVMYMGSLVELGSADDVYFEPLHPYTQTLIESNPRPDPKAERARSTVPIQGEIASPVNIGPGCRFAKRCPRVMDVCRTVTPQLRTVEGGPERRVACHLYEPAGANARVGAASAATS